MEQVLATAEADLQPKRTPAKEAGHVQRAPVRVVRGIDRPRRERGQVFGEVALLRGLQVLAPPAAVEVAMRRHGRGG